MLSELHKCGLGIILVGRYSSQNDAVVRDAILGNVGTMICFRLGASDAPKIAKHLATLQIQSRGFMNQSNYEMMVD